MFQSGNLLIGCFLLLLIPSQVLAQSKPCRFQPGLIFTGVYPNSHTQVTFTFGPYDSVIEAGSGFGIFNIWSLDASVLTVSDACATGGATTCPSSTIGTYRLTWMYSCSYVSFTAVEDNCRDRRLAYNNLTISTKSPCSPPALLEQPASVNFETSTSTCSFKNGQVWAGNYGGSMLPVSQVIGLNSLVAEANNGFYVFSKWNQTSSTAVNVTDYCSIPYGSSCATNLVGRYSLNFTSNCSVVQFGVINDTCSFRKGYNGMKLKLNPPCATPEPTPVEYSGANLHAFFVKNFNANLEEPIARDQPAVNRLAFDRSTDTNQPIASDSIDG